VRWVDRVTLTPRRSLPVFPDFADILRVIRQFQKSANRRHSFDQLVGVGDKVHLDLHAETQKVSRTEL
jgi:hypothetical protein